MEQHQHSTAESISNVHCFQVIPDQRPHSKKLGRQQRQRRTPTLYVGLALEDASEGETLLVSVESADKFDNCALAVSPKELAKENEALERVRVRTKKDTEVAMMGERTHGRRAVARKEAKGKRKVAREKQEHVGRAA